MPGNGSNYSLLRQVDDQPATATRYPGASFYESSSGERGKVVGDWNLDSKGVSYHRRRIAGSMLPALIGFQRQSSGSSFGDSSLSGEYYATSISAATSDADGFSNLQDIGGIAGDLRYRVAEETGGVGGGGSSSSKSWAQQTEESYQLQLALAVRLSLEATCVDDPNFLDPLPDQSTSRSSSSEPAESISHRFWESKWNIIDIGVKVDGMTDSMRVMEVNVRQNLIKLDRCIVGYIRTRLDWIEGGV